MRLSGLDPTIKMHGSKRLFLILNMALDLDPEDWVTLSNKSAVLIKQDKLFDAMKCIDKVLYYIPEHADSLFTKGYIFQKENRFEDALEYIERSLEYDPDNVKALSKKAFVLARMGKPEIAIDVMKNALKLNMGNAKTWYYKGVVHHYAGDYEKAIEAYQESLYIDPGVARVIGCKERAEKEMEPSMESIQGASDSLEPENNLSSNEGVEDLISKLNGKFSTS
jgi:tetratricopeptide (TPR) repeat protein